MKRVSWLHILKRETPALHSAGWLSPLTLATLATFTALTLFSGCGPVVQGDGNTTTAGGTVSGDSTAFIASGSSQSFTITGQGSTMYPSSGVIQGVDSRLLIQIQPGSLQTLTPPTGYSYTNWAPSFTCQGFTLQLQQVLSTGAVQNVGGPVVVAPLKVGSGSTFCDSQAGSLNRTTAPTAIVVDFSSSLNRLAGAQGYRVAISAATNDYKYQSCLAGCAANMYTCGGWNTAQTYQQLYAPATQRCASYGLQPIYQTHTVQGIVAVSINNQ